MAYAMTKQGSLDNCVTYEFICDTIADMNAIENRYRTIGSVAVVLTGESGGMEAYITGSNKQWNNLGSLGASDSGSNSSTGGLSIHICAQNEVSNGKPNIASPDETTIYLVSAGNESGNLYEEYIYVNNAWEKFGAASIDISGKADKTDTVLETTLSRGRKANTTVATASFAFGENVTASGSYSHAEGYNTTASTTYAHAEGNGTTASGSPSHAEGTDSTASASNTHAEGLNSVASASQAHAEGNATISSGIGAHSEGINTKATADASHAEGYNTQANGLCSHAEGSGAKTSSTYAHAEGENTLASGVGSHAEGLGGTYTKNNVTYTSEAQGAADHTEGYQTRTASGQPGNHAEGYWTAAIGGASHAEGAETTASGNASHAEGLYSIASGSQSHAEGSTTIASGSQSHAEGQNSTASGFVSHAEGHSTASGTLSHAEGYESTASGDYSHAEGYQTVASGNRSHAENMCTTAAGTYSHVSGIYNVVDSYSNWPDWEANTSYNVGDKVKRTAANSQIMGYICKTSNSDSSFTSSKWTEQYGKMNYAEIIGNGTTDSARSNARALDWEGNEHLMGDLYVGCNSDSTGGTKLARIPDPPTTDGTYTLQATVASGVITYSWIAGV